MNLSMPRPTAPTHLRPPAPGLLCLSARQDYGQAVIYKGSIPRHPDSWRLDGHHTMETGKVFTVCGNTCAACHT